ncbi:hypothetical protein VTN96DRAFT_5827 [Rasamsonia emersonii]
MVGTPRSTGCATCRRRKKKCGEERPQCHACLAAGWKCPGYVRRWKFVDETPQLAEHYRGKRYVFEDDGGDDENDLHNQSGLSLSYEDYYSVGGRRRGKGRRSFFSVGIFRPHPWTTTMMTTENDRNGAFLIQCMTTILDVDKDNQAVFLFPLRFHGSYLHFIPARLGRNPALDAAVSCLCAMYIDTQAKTASTRRTATRRYVQSLQALRLCVEDPQVRLQSETICVSILMQLCELLTNADNGRWNHLLRGTKILIQERGPAAFTTPFERAMLESQRAFFIAQDANSGERCFLSDAPWREVLRRPAATAQEELPSFSLRSQLCDFVVDILDLVDDASKSNSLHRLDSDTLHERILHRIISLHHSLEAWYFNHLKPLLLSSNQSKTQTGSTVYPDILLFVLDAVSNSALAMLEQWYAILAAASPHRHMLSDSTICLTETSTANREAAARSSLDFVRRKAPVAAQPLVFGLKQLSCRLDGCERV